MNDHFYPYSDAKLVHITNILRAKPYRQNKINRQKKNKEKTTNILIRYSNSKKQRHLRLQLKLITVQKNGQASKPTNLNQTNPLFPEKSLRH